MSPLSVVFACLGIVVSAIAIIVPALLVVTGSVRKLGLLEGVVTASIAELRKSVDELRDGLKQLTKIPELERRISQVEDSMTRWRDKVEKKIESMQSFKAVTGEQIKTFKEQSSPDLSRFVPRPTLPRKDP